AQRKQRPEGKNMPGRMAHKDISQLRGPGPQAQKHIVMRQQPRPKGEEKHSKKRPGPQAQKNVVS
ncbi:MAG: hypothetical protein FWB81_03850, partial [Cystobacterineae bacterium]|nr:hypothetical protein [Cystobacterineae bacterium]